ncbi:MAG: EAL domain-containing protein, partial [Thiovulaceae bacterium]|nr:EAL domain-containing protein [Sulfurimonadaceae bacterium]
MGSNKTKKFQTEIKVNENCLLARNGFTPYERCDFCELKTTKCTGLQYNFFTFSISILLLLFIFISDPLLIRINIAAIIVLLVIMGYRSMINIDDLAKTSLENVQLNNKLKRHSDALEVEVAKQTKELIELATHDKLTGLHNRYEFEKRLQLALENVHIVDINHVLCFMDLDQFKIVNDTSGHAAGDELLRQLSSLLKATMVEGDLIARIGGDEFGIIFYNASLDDARERSEKLLTSICDYRFSWEDKVFTVGASMGLVQIDKNCDNFNNLLISADAACYTAKENGRNRIHVFEQLELELSRHRNDVEWLEEINLALDEDRFLVFGQPIVALNGSGETHFELLVRMQGRDGKIIEPMVFLPSAERFGIIKQIDRWMIKVALELQRKLLDEGRSVVFSINLSGNSLGDDELIDYISKVFIDTEVPYEQICFEITETTAISNLNNALHFIQRFRALGCAFSLDDFGSGLSSFAYLKNIPVDYLKIDGQFVRDADVNPVNEQMIKAINKIAQVMNIKTICEYVESKDI